jgi:hypothetical protein
MKTSFKQKPIALLISLFAFVPSLLSGQNLITNSSFESNGQLNCDSWYDACGRELAYQCDTIPDTNCMGWFVQDAPPGGGNWSIELEPGWIPAEGFAETYVTGISGTSIIQLKVWMKAVGGFNGGGYMCLYLKGQPFWFATSCKADTASTWKQFTVTDTFTLLTTDTVVVHLSAGATEVAAWKIRFDLAELTIIPDTATGVEDFIHQREITIYPNPVSDILSIELSENSDGEIRILNSLGQLELHSRTVNQNVNFDVSGLTTGLYILEIWRSNSISREKFIKE